MTVPPSERRSVVETVQQAAVGGAHGAGAGPDALGPVPLGGGVGSGRREPRSVERRPVERRSRRWGEAVVTGAELPGVRAPNPGLVRRSEKKE